MENQSQKSGENRRARAVFRAAGADGARWLFVMLSDDVWAIRRNGKQVASGAADPASIDAGLHKFLTLATGGGLEADEHVENRSV